MEPRCPFLKEQKMAFCKAFPVRKMLPYDRLCVEENICFRGGYGTCAVYQSKEGGASHGNSPRNRKACPYLEIEEVLFCGVYPVKKMIPSSAFRLECPCTTSAYKGCHAYRQIADGDRAGEPTRGKVRGFLLDDTVYYHRCHLWMQRHDGRVRLGLDDLGQWLLGDIERINVPRLGRWIRREQTLLQIRTPYGTATIPSPLEGKVVAINPETSRDATLLAADPYGAGWLVELAPKEGLDRLASQEGFISGRDARSWLEQEVDRLHSLIETEIGVTMGDGGEVIPNLPPSITKRQWHKLVDTFLARKEE